MSEPTKTEEPSLNNEEVKNSKPEESKGKDIQSLFLTTNVPLIPSMLSRWTTLMDQAVSCFKSIY